MIEDNWKFRSGDRVVSYGRQGNVADRTWTRGVYYVRFDGDEAERRVYESELSPVEDVVTQDEPKDINEGSTKALVRERIRYHAAHQAMMTFREERDFLLEKMREANQWMDYTPESFGRPVVGCENKCDGCQTEMIETSRIVAEALARSYTNDPTK